MTIVKMPPAGSAGVIIDLPAHELPEGAWSASQNIRFREGSATKFTGHQVAYDPPTVAPYWLLPVQTTTTYYWLYAGLAKVYAADGTSHYNLTRQTAGVDVDYTGAAANKWNGGTINGVPVLNNGVDAPQMWSPVSTSQRLQQLTAWPASTTAACIRPFRNFLIALDVTKISVRYPQMVKWSHGADANAVPSSWDETDATKDAGEYELSETGGEVIDGLALRDTFVVYKSDSAWGMQYIGGENIFRFFQIFPTHGILARDCVQAFDGKHIVLTQGDLIVHDGNAPMSIVDSRMRNWLFGSMDPNYYAQSFIAPNRKKNEMWICFPTSGSSVPNTALVWNWRDNTFAIRELPNASYIAFGVVDPAEDLTWESDTGTWNSDTTAWDTRSYNPSDPTLLMASPTNTALYQADQTNQFAGTNMTAYVERSGMTFGDMTAIKRVKAIYPRITATNGTEVSVYVGHQMEIGDAISYDGPYTFTVGTDKKIDCRVTGRLIARKYQTTGDVSWKLNGDDIDVEMAGKR